MVRGWFKTCQMSNTLLDIFHNLQKQIYITTYRNSLVLINVLCDHYTVEVSLISEGTASMVS
jgi:hypothetical protein